MNAMTYRGYVGRISYDDAGDLFHGEVVNLRDVITFQGCSVEELRTALRESVEDYIEFCRSRGQEPGAPLSGEILLRVEPDLHRAMISAAGRAGVSLDDWATRRLKEAVA